MVKESLLKLLMKKIFLNWCRYTLQKFKRSNQNTCINQKPLVRVGDKVMTGDIIADGPSTKIESYIRKKCNCSIYALQGYNFED